ncbi:hypothetical protein [Microbacterium enclense]|uniref:hypothetical protein n=1 Tax=Microbacterium enclense TaxID=993073 RepID=UPI00343566F3
MPSIYSTLTPVQQWEVHWLYAPDRFFEDDELLAHVQRSIAGDPSLPNRVGKHWRRICQLYEWAGKNADGPEDWSGVHRALARARVMGQRALGTVLQPSRRKTGYVIRVAPIARPEPDYEKLARAFSELS